jgi:DNA replication protein DnaC
MEKVNFSDLAVTLSPDLSAECQKCKKKITEKECIIHDGYCQKCYKEIEEQNKAETLFQKRLSTLPPRLQRLTNETANKYINDSWFIVGDTNTGKTILAGSILKLIWRNGRAGKYVKFTELMTKLQFSENEIRLSLLDKTAKYPGLLVLDDFGGIGRVTDFVRQISYYIISYREENDLQTIITSNLSLDELANEIDERISSRIKRTCKILELKKKY